MIWLERRHIKVVSIGNKPIMPLTPYQDGILTGNRVAHVLMSEVAQCYVSENTILIKVLGRFNSI